MNSRARNPKKHGFSGVAGPTVLQGTPRAFVATCITETAPR